MNFYFLFLFFIFIFYFLFFFKKKDGKIVPTTNKSYKSENSWKLVKPSDFASIFSSETMSTESDELDLSLSSPKHGSDEVIHSPPNNHHTVFHFYYFYYFLFLFY